MSILFVIAGIALLILVHEAGHFWAAKRAGVAVPEFGIGFPPRLWGVRRGETEYTVNALPLGGFVRIGGETSEDAAALAPADREKSFFSKPIHIRAGIMAAGVFFNILAAWVLLSAAFSIGLPLPVSAAPEGAMISDVALVITEVVAGSPAERAGIAVGDRITGIRVVDTASKAITAPSSETADAFIKAAGSRAMDISYMRGSEMLTAWAVRAEAGIAPEGIAIGISMNDIGTVSFPLWRAIPEGFFFIFDMAWGALSGLTIFFAGILTGSADLSAVAGPVGIVAAATDAAAFGFAHLLAFAALLSVNLAVVNLLPVPSLDGGRLILLGVEAVRGFPVPARIARILQAASFVFLAGLVIIVTYADIARLIG